MNDTDNLPPPTPPPDDDFQVNEDDPQFTLEHIRQKMESVAQDFAAGKLNRAQFNAMYGHYSDRRKIVERLIARDPKSSAWRQAATPGHTGFLRTHFEAHPEFVIVFRHHNPRPLLSIGQPPNEAQVVIRQVLRLLWQHERPPRTGLARKLIGRERWLVMIVGELALTVVIYSLQPSVDQSNTVRDLHSDFERANHSALQRGLSGAKMVFPQRAVMEY